MDGQLGLQLGDAFAGRSELGLVDAGRAGQLPSIDEVLATPDIDRLVADAEEPGDLGDLPSGCDEIENLTTELRADSCGASRPPKAAGRSVVQQPDCIRTGAYQQ